MSEKITVHVHQDIIDLVPKYVDNRIKDTASMRSFWSRAASMR